MKSAIIGLGGISNVHIKVLEEQGHEIIGVCDIDDNKLTKYSHIKGFNDYKQMLNDVKPDVVHVCTPHYLHAQMVVDCLNRGVNVLCEKPLCINLTEGQEILKAEKASKAMLGVVHQNRYNVTSRIVKELLGQKSAKTGYATVVWNRGKDYYSSGAWRGKWTTEGGGVMINQALHTLDLLQWFLGMPQSVCASVNTLKLEDIIEVEDTVSALYEGEKSFQFFATNCGGVDFPIEIVLKLVDGGLVRLYPDGVYLNGEKIDTPKSCISQSALGGVYGKQCYGSGHCGLIADFYDCVKNGKKFDIDGEEGLKVIKLILSAYKSKNKKVDI